MQEPIIILVMFYLLTDEFEKAIANYDMSLKLDPDDAYILLPSRDSTVKSERME